MGFLSETAPVLDLLGFFTLDVMPTTKGEESSTFTWVVLCPPLHTVLLGVSLHRFWPDINDLERDMSFKSNNQIN